MKKYGFEFKANGLEYFLWTLLWALLLSFTLGLALPLYVLWNFRWFADRLKIVAEK